MDICVFMNNCVCRNSFEFLNVIALDMLCFQLSKRQALFPKVWHDFLFDHHVV